MDSKARYSPVITNSKYRVNGLRSAALRPATQRPMGPKAFFLEPCLIVGSAILWLAVLPFAGLIWSGTALAKRTHLL